MTVKLVVDSLEGVPEALREFYVEREGSFVLQAEDVAAHPDVKTLRSAHDKEKADRKRLAQRARELEERFGDLDPDAAREALAKLTANDPEALRRTHEREIGQLQTKLSSLGDERDRAVEALRRHRVDAMVQETALRLGAKPSMMRFITREAAEVFSIDAESGAPVALAEDGPLVDAKGNALTVDTWMEALRREHGDLFAPSRSGGATGSQSGSGLGNGVKMIDRRDAGQFLAEIVSGKVMIRD